MSMPLSTFALVLPGHFVCSRLHARFCENNEALERKLVFAVRQLRVPDIDQMNTLKSLCEVRQGLPDGKANNSFQGKKHLRRTHRSLQAKEPSSRHTQDKQAVE